MRLYNKTEEVRTLQEMIDALERIKSVCGDCVIEHMVLNVVPAECHLESRDGMDVVEIDPVGWD